MMIRREQPGPQQEDAHFLCSDVFRVFVHVAIKTDAVQLCAARSRPARDLAASVTQVYKESVNRCLHQHWVEWWKCGGAFQTERGPGTCDTPNATHTEPGVKATLQQ